MAVGEEVGGSVGVEVGKGVGVGGGVAVGDGSVVKVGVCSGPPQAANKRKNATSRNGTRFIARPFHHRPQDNVTDLDRLPPPN